MYKFTKKNAVIAVNIVIILIFYCNKLFFYSTIYKFIIFDRH